MREILIILISIIINFSISYSQEPNLVFKYSYGKKRGYVNNLKLKIFEDGSLDSRSVMLATDTNYLIFNVGEEKNKIRYLGFMNWNKEIIVPPIFQDIHYLSNTIFLGTKQNHCRIGYYQMFEFSDTVALYPECFTFERTRDKLTVLKLNQDKYVLSLDKSTTLSMKAVRKKFFILGDTLLNVFSNEKANLFRVAPLSQKSKAKLDSFPIVAREMTDKYIEGTRFRYDSLNRTYRVYKDWFTNDTVMAILTDVKEIGLEYFAPQDSTYYFLSMNHKGEFGIKNHKNEITFPFSNLKPIESIAIDSNTEFLIIESPEGLKGIYTYKNRKIIPIKYKNIRLTELFGRPAFECQDTEDKYGYLDIKGKVIIPIKYYEVSNQGNLLRTLDFQHASPRLHNQKGEIFSFPGRELNTYQIRDIYHQIRIYHVQLPGFDRGILEFVIDENGKMYLPAEIERPLLEVLKNIKRRKPKIHY